MITQPIRRRSTIKKCKPTWQEPHEKKQEPVLSLAEGLFMLQFCERGLWQSHEWSDELDATITQLQRDGYVRVTKDLFPNVVNGYLWMLRVTLKKPLPEQFQFAPPSGSQSEHLVAAPDSILKVKDAGA